MKKDLKIDKNTIIYCSTQRSAYKVLRLAKELGYSEVADSIGKYVNNTYELNHKLYIDIINNTYMIYYADQDNYHITENYTIIRASKFLELHSSFCDKLSQKSIMKDFSKEIENTKKELIKSITDLLKEFDQEEIIFNNFVYRDFKFNDAYFIIGIDSKINAKLESNHKFGKIVYKSIDKLLIEEINFIYEQLVEYKDINFI